MLLLPYSSCGISGEICMPHFSVHPLFARLCVVSRVTIHRLANNAIYNKLLARTDTLFIPGETATHMYIVVAGRLGPAWAS